MDNPKLEAKNFIFPLQELTCNLYSSLLGLTDGIDAPELVVWIAATPT